MKIIKTGKIVLPELRDTPDFLVKLFVDCTTQSKLFRYHIRAFNNAFSMSSIGVDRKMFKNGPYVFKIGGMMHHRIGQIAHDQNDNPKFAQIYIYDPKEQIKYRSNINGLNEYKKIKILELIQKWLLINNELAKKFYSAYDIFKNQPSIEIKLVLKCNIKPPNAHSGTYNLPTTDEIAVIIPGNSS